jgi:hypothetical protein
MKVSSKKSKTSRIYRKFNIKQSEITPSLLQKALKTGTGHYAHTFVKYMALKIISKATPIEISLKLILPDKLANIMIYFLRIWDDFGIYAERVLLDNVALPTVDILKHTEFTIKKIKYSHIENSIVLLGKILIAIAIIKQASPSFIKKLKKEFS